MKSKTFMGCKRYSPVTKQGVKDQQWVSEFCADYVSIAKTAPKSSTSQLIFVFLELINLYKGFIQTTSKGYMAPIWTAGLGMSDLKCKEAQSPPYCCLTRRAAVAKSQVTPQLMRMVCGIQPHLSLLSLCTFFETLHSLNSTSVCLVSSPICRSSETSSLHYWDVLKQMTSSLCTYSTTLRQRVG